MTSMSDLRLLGELILQSIQTIESRLESENLQFPALKEPLDHTCKVEGVLLEAEISTAGSHIVAAASQLIAMVRSPVETMIENGLLFHLPACIRAVEIIREAGVQGIHVDDIAKKNNTDSNKAGRILRLLANNHIFTEICPDVFSANRLSSVLDSGSSLAELQKNPDCKYKNTLGISALVLMETDEAFKGSAYLSEVFTDPTTAHSMEPNASPWNISANTDEFLFDWYDLPQNAGRKTRFSFAMACSTNLEPPGAALSGFGWTSLPRDAIIVDVGGGVGSTALILARAIPHVNIVVQDRASVIDDAKMYWAEEAPDVLESGRVTLEVHDFFTCQPPRNVAVFFLRWILHDWADPSAVRILQTLRQAAKPETKLVTMDVIIPYTCSDTSTDLIRSKVPEVPAPLLPNMGSASNMKYWLDLQMFVLGNCQERTLVHLVRLAHQGGWEVSEVHHINGSSLAQCVFVPRSLDD
ncbi:O-methyltransferase [Mycena leptocephala]|nr:O-methyltransferase [Mycena leptocephala]